MATLLEFRRVLFRSNTVPGRVSQAMSNAVWTVMLRAGIDTQDDLDIPDHVRKQVLGHVPMTVDGLATIADALGVEPSAIVDVADDDIRRHRDCDHGHDDEPILTDDPGKITKLTGPNSVAEAIQARQRGARVSLEDLAAELGIIQSTDPWQPLPPVDVLKAFDQTIPRVAHSVTQVHADHIRAAWIGGDQR